MLRSLTIASVILLLASCAMMDDEAVSGDTALIGSWLDDDKGSIAGSAYSFVRSGTNWSQTPKLLADDLQNWDQETFGVSAGNNIKAIR